MHALRMKVCLIGLSACLLASLTALLLGDDSEKTTAGGNTASAARPTAGGWPESVSIVDLLARPDAYDGKLVRLDGYLHVKFEGTAIFMTKEHADHLMTKYGLWVSFKDGHLEHRELDCKYVLLEGVFNKAGKGHMGLWSGELRNISRVMEKRRFYDGEKVLPKPQDDPATP